MITPPTESPWARILASMGTGATLIALAFTVRPIHAGRWVFWIVIAAGSIALTAGWVPFIRGLVGRWRRDTPSRRRRAATECRRAQAALDAFLLDHARLRPKGGVFAASVDRADRWRDEVAASYRRELRSWATQVFAEAVAFGAVSSSARPLVEAPGATRIAVLRDLFRDAADQLDLPSS